ncbi:MAG: MFS transporter [Mangrovibacterium sp.]
MPPMKSSASEDEVSTVHFGELLKPGLFKILLLGIFLAVLQQWCGMNVIFYYAASLAAVSLRIGNSLLTFTFPAIKENLGWTLNFWLYAVICLIGLLVVVFKLPETKGKSLEEIEEILTN